MLRKFSNLHTKSSMKNGFFFTHFARSILPIFSPIFQDFCHFIHLWNIPKFFGFGLGGSSAGLGGTFDFGGTGFSGCINPWNWPYSPTKSRSFQKSIHGLVIKLILYIWLQILADRLIRFERRGQSERPWWDRRVRGPGEATPSPKLGRSCKKQNK